jgi:hypothetical protein
MQEIANKSADILFGKREHAVQKGNETQRIRFDGHVGG